MKSPTWINTSYCTSWCFAEIKSTAAEISQHITGIWKRWNSENSGTKWMAIAVAKPPTAWSLVKDPPNLTVLTAVNKRQKADQPDNPSVNCKNSDSPCVEQLDKATNERLKETRSQVEEWKNKSQWSYRCRWICKCNREFFSVMKRACCIIPVAKTEKASQTLVESRNRGP